MSIYLFENRLIDPKTFPWGYKLPDMAGRPWTAAQLVTQAWMDAADADTIAFSSGATLAQLNDKSGNNRHADEIGTAAPTIAAASLNGLDTIAYSGNGQAIKHAEIPVVSVFIVCKWAGTSGTYRHFLNSSYHFHGHSSSSDLFSSSYGSCSGYYGNGYLDGTARTGMNMERYTSWRIINLEPRQSDSPTIYLMGDGGPSFPARCFWGNLAEYIVLDYIPSTAERQKIEGYLAHKWGLAMNLPPGHPYETEPPTT